MSNKTIPYKIYLEEHRSKLFVKNRQLISKTKIKIPETLKDSKIELINNFLKEEDSAYKKSLKYK